MPYSGASDPLVAFLAVRTDGKPPLEGRCLGFDSLENMHANFPQLWQTLSPAGLAEKRLSRLLHVGEDVALPPKLSTYVPSYPRYRYPSELQTSLRAVSELLLIDVVDMQEIERRFYEGCYSESGALSANALVSK